MNVVNVAVDSAAIWMIVIASLVSGLILAMEHWFPWQSWLGKPLPRIPSYVMGMLALYLPISIVLVVWQSWIVLILMWFCGAVGGAVVCVGYFIDHYLSIRNAKMILEEEKELICGQVIEDQN